ncbi:hypothetical protein U0070_001053 [Myodes glareolus]|uniref:Uncharacterized protein n=1 Tax=Myodes glareolus TaxID=447135 RepID=A0AAW0IWQ4_MYOGA
MLQDGLRSFSSFPWFLCWRPECLGGTLGVSLPYPLSRSRCQGFASYSYEMLIAPQTTQGGRIQGYHFPLPSQRGKKRNLPGKQQAENFGNGSSILSLKMADWELMCRQRLLQLQRLLDGDSNAPGGFESLQSCGWMKNGAQEEPCSRLMKSKPLHCRMRCWDWIPSVCPYIMLALWRASVVKVGLEGGPLGMLVGDYLDQDYFLIGIQDYENRENPLEDYRDNDRVFLKDNPRKYLAYDLLTHLFLQQESFQPPTVEFRSRDTVFSGYDLDVNFSGDHGRKWFTSPEGRGHSVVELISPSVPAFQREADVILQTFLPLRGQHRNDTRSTAPAVCNSLCKALSALGEMSKMLFVKFMLLMPNVATGNLTPVHRSVHNLWWIRKRRLQMA